MSSDKQSDQEKLLGEEEQSGGKDQSMTEQKNEQSKKMQGTGEKQSMVDMPSAPPAAPKTLSQQYAKIFFVVAIYWTVSISMVFVNKTLLSGYKDFSAPFFVTWFQCVVTVLACYMFASLSKSFPGKITFPRVAVDLAVAKRILPLSIVFVAMITFNNLCLKNVGVSFYYVGRSLTTVFNVVATYFVLKQNTSLRACLACGIIVGGFFMGVDQEDTLGTISVSGVFYGVFASLFVCLYSIYTKKVLPIVDDNIWMLAFYNNVNACFLFLPIILLGGEIPVIMTSMELWTLNFWFNMMLGGMFGFAIGYVTGLQIQTTSPLTHNISGTSKAATQTLMATQINAEEKNFMWWVSNVLVLVGTLAYARVRQQEMAQRNRDEQVQKQRAQDGETASVK